MAPDIDGRKVVNLLAARRGARYRWAQGVVNLLLQHHVAPNIDRRKVVYLLLQHRLQSGESHNPFLAWNQNFRCPPAHHSLPALHPLPAPHSSSRRQHGVGRSSSRRGNVSAERWCRCVGVSYLWGCGSARWLRRCTGLAGWGVHGASRLGCHGASRLGMRWQLVEADSGANPGRPAGLLGQLQIASACLPACHGRAHLSSCHLGQPASCSLPALLAYCRLPELPAYCTYLHY